MDKILSILNGEWASLTPREFLKFSELHLYNYVYTMQNVADDTIQVGMNTYDYFSEVTLFVSDMVFLFYNFPREHLEEKLDEVLKPIVDKSTIVSSIFSNEKIVIILKDSIIREIVKSDMAQDVN